MFQQDLDRNGFYLGGFVWPRSGFLCLLLMVLRLAPDALAVIGLPCISFVFLNLGTHGRTKLKPYGNETTRQYVKDANTKLGSISYLRLPVSVSHVQLSTVLI